MQTTQKIIKFSTLSEDPVAGQLDKSLATCDKVSTEGVLKGKLGNMKNPYGERQRSYKFNSLLEVSAF